MKKLELNDPETKSADIVSENIAALQAVFPDAFREGKIDFDILKQLLGGAVDDREEKYGLNWHGKRQARQMALTPSVGTLLPCPDDSVDWEKTQNLMIEGDNLEVLKLLQKSYAGRVKLIYIDPPYNTGKDFIYPDNFHDSINNYLSLTGQLDSQGRKSTSNPESSGRFHTDWLTMMYPRLKLARTLLQDDGVIFISIDDAEFANIRNICDDIFGEENFLATFVRRRRMATGMRDSAVSPDHEYVVGYARRMEAAKLFGFARQASDFPFNDEISSYRSTDLTVGMTKEMRPNQFYPVRNPRTGSEYFPPEERVWRFEPSTMIEHIAANNIIWPDDNLAGRMTRPRFKTRYFPDEEKSNPVSTWIQLKESSESAGEEMTSLVAGLNQEATKEVRELLGGQVLEYPKPLSLLRGLITISTKADDIVLDFFAGSGTTAHAVWLTNIIDGGKRRYLAVQLPEPTGREDFSTISEITKERLRRAALKIRAEVPNFAGDLGFRVYKLARSNIRTWEPVSSDLEGTLLANAEHIVPGRTEQDILYELLLKLGLDLCVPIETRQIAGKNVHAIGGGALIACLADGLAKDVVESLSAGIVAWWRELAPAVETRVVFKDSGFSDDVAKTNMAAILNQNGILDVRSL